MPAFITRPDGTSLYFDLTDSEKHVGDAEVTDFPVEEGVDISDNMRVRPPPFVMRCTITNTPIVPSGNQPDTVPGKMTSSVEGQVKIDTTPYVPPAQLASAIINPVGTAVTLLSGPYGPTSVTANVLLFPQDFDAHVDALSILADMQSKAELLQITTSITIYDDYVLEHFELLKDGSAWQTVDLTFKYINIVQTTTSAQPFVSEPKATPPKNKGQQSPTPAPPKVDLLTVLLGNNNPNAQTNIFTGAAQSNAGNQL